MAVTRLQAVASVLQMLGDTEEAVWTSSEVVEYLQSGYDDYCHRTLLLWLREQLPDVAAQALYDLPTGFIKMERAEKTQAMILPTSSRYEVVMNPGFETSQARTWRYLMEGDGFSKLRKIPVPSASATDFYIEYYSRGTVLAEDNTEFDIPDRYVKYLTYYACAKCLERDGDGQDLKLSDYWMTRYASGVLMIERRKSRFAARRLRQVGGAGDKMQTPKIGSYPANFPRD